MHRKWKGWIKAAGLAALACASAAVLGQPASGDWRTYGGSSAREGHNLSPASLFGPGQSKLIWWRPDANDTVGSTYVIDNLPLTINALPVSSTFPVGTWNAPTTVAEEANNPFVPAPYINDDPAVSPSYRYAFTTPSIDTDNPEVPQNAAAHATSQWSFDFAAFGDPARRNYALYVWLPLGPTLNAGIFSYQQRYWVYEVFFANGERLVDVVDTYVAGTGWVRLGGGGRQTNVTFGYDGVSPIRIVLHNTVPRGETGGLLDTPGTTLVYADAAMAVPQRGGYRSSPIVSEFGAGGPGNTHVVAALNATSTAFIKNGTRATPITVTKGQVVSHNFATGATRWAFEPLAESENVNFVDNSAAAVTPGLGWLSQVLPATFFGSDYLSAPITATAGTETATVYAPTLDPGSYEIWVWLPGNGGGIQFGTSVLYEVVEGATVTPIRIDQSVNRGWVRVGTRRFDHERVVGEPLSLRITNFSFDPLDVGRQSYADAVRFVGASDLAVDSTPVSVDALVRLTPGGPLELRSVTLVAAENGRIYCLDSAGNGNGTTQVLWTYPSTPDPNNTSWTDPNHVSGEDGVGPEAEMPIGFDLSSALVERIDGEDWLFIGSSNGRVYKIAMAGRGDMNTALNLPGTTTRAWSFPSDYPARQVPSTLGPIEGSIAFATTTDGPTIFVPASAGRMYALDARGNPANKTTTTRWTFPSTSQPTLGSIVGTPAVAFGKIFFGTQVKTGNAAGEFIALDINTGALSWFVNGSTNWGVNVDLQRAGDYNSGPVAIPAAEMSGMPDTVVVANDNLWVTAYDAATGTELWTTNELGATVIGNLSFTHQIVFDNASALGTAPVVVIPVNDGRIMSLFAETARTNVFGGTNRLAWGFFTDGPLTSQVSVGRGWMYAADEAGTLYGFNSSLGGPVSPGNPPGSDMVPPNDPAGLPFREASIKFVTKDTYERLVRLAPGNANHLSYAQANDPARAINRIGFEWGETIYALVYNFPFDLSANPAPPGLTPQINFRFSVEGASVRNLTINSKQFSSPGSAPVSAITGEALDGYAITSFTLQGSGSTALPPGPAEATFTVNAQFAPGARLQSVAINPTTARRVFSIANPIGISTKPTPAGLPDPPYSLGNTVNPDDAEALLNGSFDITGTAKREDLLLSNFGMVAHGQPGSSQMALLDRSMMYLIRGPGRGLDGVRMVRSDLHWQGGAGAVYKPIDQTRYPLTEQLPVNFPNDSLDYPNITREFISVVKDKFGNVENPLYSGVSLLPPLPATDPNDPTTRPALVPTPVDIDVAVPRFQPPNATPVLGSNPLDGSIPAGYYGPVSVFVDSTGNGQLDRRGRREAFRTFWLGGSVTVDERIEVETPVVDLGSLAQGAGYSPLSPGTAFADDFNPWTGMFASFYRPFVVRNTGNVNMLNMRLAKATNDPVNGLNSWGLFAPANHERSWMDTRYSMWSDIDSVYALPFGASNSVLLQKARPGDRSGTTLTTNPVRRENPFLDVNSGPVNAAGPEPANPRVAVSVPIGTPVGTYITTIRVIEDKIGQDESLSLDGNLNPLEPYSDPTFTLRFNVREGRVTNSHTTGTAPMAHGTLTGNENFIHKNVQPTAFRDGQNGEIVVAWAGTGANFADPQPADASLNDRYRIFIATMNGTTPGSTAGTNPKNPLRDLLGWTPPGTGRWFVQAAGPLPAQAPDALFSSAAGESVLPESVKFGAPSFPILGKMHPLTGSQMAGSYMAYLGQAEKQTPNGRLGETRVFLQRIDVDGSGTVTPGTPVAMPFDPTVGKGRPAVVQSDARATVFYAGGGTGTNTLYFSHFDGASFGQPQALNLGNGFESFGTPSVSARTYVGQSVPGLASGTPILELTFSGKLRNRQHSEVYFARLLSDSRLVPVNVPGQRTHLLYLPQRIEERLVAGNEPGTYNAQGLLWNVNDPVNNPIVLQQRIGNTITNLELNTGSRTFDRETGLITMESVLGGRIYIDPTMGTVRFSGTAPARNATLLLSYTPRILRISTSGGAAYTGPSGLFDYRLVGELSYWADPQNQAADSGDRFRNDRFVFTYSRAAAGTGSAARPYMRTMRLGGQLRHAIHTQPNGNVTAFTVSGMSTAANSFYQVDPSNGRVYFTAENENMAVVVNYTGVDEATGAPLPNLSETFVVTPIGERAEGPIPIEQAVNESQLFSFIDLVDSISPGNVADRRPNLIWMVFTSTRAGGPDVYIQTMAPKFTPVAAGVGG